MFGDKEKKERKKMCQGLTGKRVSGYHFYLLLFFFFFLFWAWYCSQMGWGHPLCFRGRGDRKPSVVRAPGENRACVIREEPESCKSEQYKQTNGVSPEGKILLSCLLLPKLWSD
jgi:hypothetical protein